MSDPSDRKARILFTAVLTMSAIAAGAWYVFASARYATYQIVTSDAVSGLIADAPVEFHGVEVGKVKGVELTGPRTVRILLDVKHDAPISSATIATITSRGLATRGFTGYVYVALDNVGSNVEPLVALSGEMYPVIPARPSKSVNLDTAISQVSEDVQALTLLVRSLLDQRTIVSLKSSAESLQRITSTLSENNVKLGAIIRNTERASDRINPLLETSNDTVKALQSQVLPEAHKALTELDRLSSTLAGAAAKIERDPSVVLRGAARPPPGPGEKK